MVLRLKWVIAICLTLSFLNTINSYAETAPKFKIKKIQLEHKLIKKVIYVEIAENSAQQSYGLMFRNKLNTNAGMLFVFQEEKTREFWMKNTLINLDIGYFNKNKILIDVQQMEATNSVMQTNLKTYPSSKPAMYALEMNEGWFKKNKIILGAKLKY